MSATQQERLFAVAPPKIRVEFTLVARNRAGEIVPPRTKKNSPQIVPHMRYAILVPSEAYREWARGCKSALRHLILQDRLERPIGESPIFPICQLINCRAIFYRDRNVGDAVGYYQALGDLLQEDVSRKGEPEMKVLSNDKWIVSWDGTRLDKDPANPRVEVVLEEI